MRLKLSNTFGFRTKQWSVYLPHGFSCQTKLGIPVLNPLLPTKTCLFLICTSFKINSLFACLIDLGGELTASFCLLIVKLIFMDYNNTEVDKVLTPVRSGWAALFGRSRFAYFPFPKLASGNPLRYRDCHIEETCSSLAGNTFCFKRQGGKEIWSLRILFLVGCWKSPLIHEARYTILLQAPTSSYFGYSRICPKPRFYAIS